jgi:hypothetical protein
MSRFGVIWFLLVIASGIGNFIVKQNVQNLDDQLTNVRRQTVAEQKKIHELTADWTFLNQPQLLTDLNNRYVHLAAMSPKQVLTNIDSIPLRPTPPPQEPLPQIAAATPIPPPAPPTEPAAAPVQAPIVPVSATVSVRQPVAPVAMIVPARPETTQAAPPASLDTLFAQVTGNR